MARDFVQLARRIRAGRGPVAAPACVMAGGETTVTVRGAGREAVARSSRWPRPSRWKAWTGWWSWPPAPTGPTAPPTRRAPWPTARARAGPASAATRAARLDANDSHPVLAALGDLVVTGPTNTNLLDLYLLLVP